MPSGEPKYNNRLLLGYALTMYRHLIASLSFAGIIGAACWAASPAATAAPPTTATPTSATATPAPAAPPAIAIPSAPQVDARAFILVDYQTNQVLAEKESTARMEPASLTKLMTAYIVFRELAAGKLKLEDMVTVSEHAWRSEGSRTFIELGKPVSVQDLILGMIVQSGNDATIALAERIAGTEDTFAQLMNSTAKQLNMLGTHFENSSGLPSPQHYTTARDMSLLANAMIRDFPQYYKYYSIHEFEHNGIKQQNRNGLLEKDPSVDGLKTGHTDSAGFCLVTSAHREGMRLVSVVLGSTSMKARENASAALLSYGFTFYDTKLVVKGGTVLATTHVWKAAHSPVDVGIKEDLYMTLARGQSAVNTVVDVTPKLIAPLTADANVGTLRVFSGGKSLATVPLQPLQPVPAGGWWRRLIDTIRLWFA
jgi:serine-type D-Ala-D-Ala carboxypeptidase (penicillin-binding protein 5/6)